MTCYTRLSGPLGTFPSQGGVPLFVMPVTDPPIWRFARVCVICGTLLVLQLLTATTYDVALNGEAGTLAGVALTAALVERLRQR